MRIERPLIMEECSFDEPVHVGTSELLSLSLRGSRIPRLDGYGVTIRGDLDLTNAIAGRVGLFGAQVEGRVWLVRARLSCADGYALDAPDMVVSGGMYCGGGFSAQGGMNLYGASIGAGLELNKARLVNRCGFALRAHNIAVASDLSCSGTVFAGGAELFGAEVGGHFWLNGARMSNADEWALNAPNLRVRGGLYARDGMSAEGGVNLYGASVGAGIELDGARAVRRDGVALRAARATVAGNLTCGDGFRAIGGVVLSDCRVDGRLSFRGAHFAGGESAVLDCANARLGVLFLDQLRQSPRAVLLTGAAMEVFHDDADFSPDCLDLDRARYELLSPHRPACDRIGWMMRGQTRYQPWCYEQLAAYYRRIGHDEEARTVLLVKQRNRRAGLRLPAKLWGRLQDVTVGYGYRPLRALGWILAGIAATACYFGFNPPARTGGDGTAHFVAAAYAADVFLPVLDLGQQRAFSPQGPGQWVAWAAVLAGWVLTTTVVAGVTRALTRP
ncbi:hypothetical protein [Streptomyces albofaciens]|uniref:hypothetical protein n=1 Tax=Streptomyces albofaciens TaxID=66866 RepID=UPI00123C68B3|nr:hypothetical protein [Streptomyces albofaciens]